MHFGISTQLFHDERLSIEHLRAVAAHGFDALEVFATRTHLDYHDPAAVEQLARWLEDTRLRLHSVHAPIAESRSGGAWGPMLSTATPDEPRRRHAVGEICRALELATRIPFSYLVVHLGVPETPGPVAGDNQREAARRSVIEIQERAAVLGVTLAIEVIPNRLSTPEVLRRLVDDLDLDGVGLCLDTGHAHLAGDIVDAIEEASGHIVTTHVHDNDGRADAHRLPFDGTIAWDEALISFQKVGFDGAFVFELARTTEPADVLERTRHVRRRLEEIAAS